MGSQIEIQSAWADMKAIRRSAPLIHNITNYVVMEHTANALLAIGASPVMAHAPEEVEEMALLSSSLVLNIGTLSPYWVQAMAIALKAANKKKNPVVLDPVGAGATSYRTETANSLLNFGKITALRGNASEIASLAGGFGTTKGVDSNIDSSDNLDFAKTLAKKRNCAVWMSGKVDVITDGGSVILVHNGHPMMAKVTGMGCTATAITGAFLAVNDDPLQACAHAAVSIGVAGEIAAEKAKGPGSFKIAFIDALFDLTEEKIDQRIKMEYA